MKISVVDTDLSGLRADLAVCFAYENDRQPRGVPASDLRRALAAEMKKERFRGQATDSLIWNANGRFGAHRFLVLGLGPIGHPAGDAIRLGCARAARAASRFAATRLAVRLPGGGTDVAADVRAAVEGAMLGGYHFERHLTDKTRRLVPLKRLEVSVERRSAAATRAARRGEIGGRAVCLVRDLVNEGPSRKDPATLARFAAKAARGAGLRCSVLDEPRIRRLGFGALLSVARGSHRPPRVVHLVYKPARGKPRERIVLVGKGVTFDSGGLNLKPSEAMFTMKMDMAGAATVLGAMTTLRDLGCRAEVHALLGLVENMTGADAYKPGDILETYSGKTVEVGNTDAEGRLVLCDLLAYAADKLKPTRVVDVATLTGACVVALGMRASGVFARSDDLANALIDAGRAAGEKLWRMPLYDDYLPLLQKGPADLRSTGGRWGGAITAALFLGEFVPRQLPWLHLDIAGPAYTETELPEARTGATGHGVLTLMRWLEAV